jgi:hypothetical protein
MAWHRFLGVDGSQVADATELLGSKKKTDAR